MCNVLVIAKQNEPKNIKVRDQEWQQKFFCSEIDSSSLFCFDKH